MSGRLRHLRLLVSRAGGLRMDERGQALRHYVLAVILAAALVIVVGTILAGPLYRGFTQLFGP